MAHDSIHPTDAEIGQFCRHEMTAEALVAFSDHLAACDVCRARAGRARTGAPDLIENLDELVDHVSDEELYAYVHGSMAADRAQSLEGHLAVCASCAAEVRDLASFAAAHAQERRIGLRYGAFAAAVALVAAGAALWLRGGGRPPSIALVDSGGDIIIDGRGILHGADALAFSDRDAVRQALVSSTLPVSPITGSLTGKAGTLMGGADDAAFTPLSPVAVVTLEDRPAFRWTAVSGASDYTVTVQDEIGGGTLESGMLDRTEWTPDTPLRRGRTYRWQVVARVGADERVAPVPTDPVARFRVLDQATFTALANAPASHTVRAVMYARAGLIEEARGELSQLAALNPGRSVVERWIAQLAPRR